MKKLFFVALALSFTSSSLMAEYTPEDARFYAMSVCGNENIHENSRDIYERCAQEIAKVKYEIEQFNKQNRAKQKQTKSKTNKKQKDYCAPNNPYCN